MRNGQRWEPTHDMSHAWRALAECEGVGTEVFFATVGGAHSYDRARRLCERCPVLGECRADNDRAERHASGTIHIHGFRAGETPRERVARRRRLRAA